MTSRRPYWCPKTMKRRPCWCPKQILWELNFFLIQTLSFVPINLHRCWPCEWKQSIYLNFHLSVLVPHINWNYWVFTYLWILCSFLAVPLGSIPELPAQTCEEIKASEEKAVSDEYWLQTVESRPPELTHCNMSTYGRCLAHSFVFAHFFFLPFITDFFLCNLLFVKAGSFRQAVSHQYIWLDIGANNHLSLSGLAIYDSFSRILGSKVFVSSHLAGFESKEIFRGAIYTQRVVIRQAQSSKVGSGTYLIFRYLRATIRRNSAWLPPGSWPEADCKTVVLSLLLFFSFSKSIWCGVRVA